MNTSNQMPERKDNPHPVAPDHGGCNAVAQATVSLPCPTAYPFALALGVTLIWASLVTNYYIAFLGLALFVIAATGWFRQVLPHPRHEPVAIVAEAPDITTTRRRVARIQLDETHRAQLPLQMYPISSGIKGGIAGGLAMIIPAEIYGLIEFHSLWYTVNLLGGAGTFGSAPTLQQLKVFHFSWFITALCIHAATSLLVGLLYGALLPVLPRHPILLGGVIAPLLWTGLLHSILGIVNPYFDQRISWPWFAASQFLFGLAAGFTVFKLGGMRRLAQLPLAARLGVQTPGISPPRPQQRDDDSEERR